MSQIRVGIIGLGFMGRTHLASYRSAIAAGYDCTVRAIADANIQRALQGAGGNIELGKAGVDLSGIETLSDPGALLARGDIDLVSICTPTDTHVDLAIRAVKSGKHVLLEKPVALTAAEVQRLADEVAKTDRVCMPAMCMRFWPGWAWLREKIHSGEFGRVLSATFQRLGSAPDWSPEFYANYERTGGPLFDLHIHDVDFVRWCFGEPREVVSTGSLAHVTSLYRYGKGGKGGGGGPAQVVAEGGQDHAPGFGFKMRYSVAFERATADFDLGRTPQLLLCKDGKAEPVDTSGPSGYDLEVRHILDLVLKRATTPVCALADAVATTRVLEIERQNVL